jgi:hypothetical protein
MNIRNWILAFAGMTVWDAHGQSGNTVGFTTLVCPHPVIPAKAGIQHLYNLVPKIVPFWILFLN